MCCSHLASSGKKVTQAAVHLLQLGDQVPQVALATFREILQDGEEEARGYYGASSSYLLGLFSKPTHSQKKPQTHSTASLLPQEPLVLLHELDALVVPLSSLFYKLQALQQEILLLFQVLHVLQLQDKAQGCHSLPWGFVKSQELVSP